MAGGQIERGLEMAFDLRFLNRDKAIDDRADSGTGAGQKPEALCPRGWMGGGA